MKFWAIGLTLWACLGGFTSGYAQTPEPGGKLNLKNAIGIALEKNPNITEFRERTKATEAQIGVSRANYFPQIRYFDNYYYGNAFISTLPTLGGAGSSPSSTSGSAGTPTSTFQTPVSPVGSYDNKNYYIHRFTLNQLIFDFGKTPGQVSQSKANFGGSQMDYANTRQQVVLDTRAAYYGFLATKRAVKVSEESVRQYQELVRQAEGFYKVGTRARIDVTKAEANLYTAESDLIRAKNNFQISQVNLMTAMGLKTWPYSDLTDELQVGPFPMTLEEAKRLAFNNRPDLLKNKYQQQFNQAGIQVARAGYFPSINSLANYGWQGNGGPTKDNWYVGVGVNFPLFEGLSTTYSVQQAKANLRASAADEDVIRQNINKEVEQSYLDIKAASENIRATAKAMEAAQENLRLAQGRYKSGVGSIIEITDAQVQFYQSELRNIQALYDYKNSEARLDKAMGKAY